MAAIRPRGSESISRGLKPSLVTAANARTKVRAYLRSKRDVPSERIEPSFLLGSITRYQPHQFDRLLESPYGAHLLGAMTEIPTQYIYLMASELLKREVTRASLA